MAATAIAGRSSFLRPILRRVTTRSNVVAPTRRISVSIANSSTTRSNSFSLLQTRLSVPSASRRFVRRELSTLQPIHTAIAAACLVSKLPTDAITSCEEAISSRRNFQVNPTRFMSYVVNLDDHFFHMISRLMKQTDDFCAAGLTRLLRLTPDDLPGR